MRHAFPVCALALATGLAGTCVAADAEVSFKQDLQPLLNAQCVFCHVDGAENGELNLGRRKAYAALVDASSIDAPLPRVAPGDVDKSYLVHKLRGTHLSVGGSGNSMPMVDPPRLMDPAQIDLFVRWIEQGAQNN